MNWEQARSGPDQFPTPPAVIGARVFLGVVDEIIQSLERRVLHDGDPDRGILENCDRGQLLGLVAGIAPDDRLQDDVGNVDPGDEIAVGFLLHQLRPGNRSASAGLVLDDHLDPRESLQVGLLPPGLQVGLTAGVEGDRIGDRLRRVIGRNLIFVKSRP
jgi:hypothetical protein